MRRFVFYYQEKIKKHDIIKYLTITLKMIIIQIDNLISEYQIGMSIPK